MNYITDYESIDVEEDLYFCDIEDVEDKKYKKCIIYINPNNNLKLSLKTPWLIVPFGVSNLKNKEGDITMYIITTALTPLVGKKKQFKKLIEDIDEEIETYINKELDDEDYEFKPSIKHNKNARFHNFVIGLRIKKNEYMFGMFNYDNTPCTIDKIKPGMRIRAIIELTDVFINDDTNTFRCSWNAIQIKICPDVITDKCHIRDEISDGSIVNLKKKHAKYDLNCPNCSHSIELNININIPESVMGSKISESKTYIPSQPRYYSTPPVSSVPIPPPIDIKEGSDNSSFTPFVPKLDDLLSALKKLKPTKTIIKESEMGHVVPEAPPLDDPIINSKKNKSDNQGDISNKQVKLLHKMKKFIKKMNKREADDEQNN
jgi:hypothetical protein